MVDGHGPWAWAWTWTLVSICYQIINRVSEVIIATDGARHLAKDACDLHCPIWIKQKHVDRKAPSSDHHFAIERLTLSPNKSNKEIN